jgi:hypothetical protein
MTKGWDKDIKEFNPFFGLEEKAFSLLKSFYLFSISLAGAA